MVFPLALLIGSAAAGPIPPIALDLTGCWEMGASNGRTPEVGCGTAPLDKGDGLIYLSQSDEGAIDACLSQVCYRPAAGMLTNTSTGAGMLRLHTLTDKGNCTSQAMPHMPADGLLEHFNFILPIGWPEHGNQTKGTHVAATDLSGVFVNNDNPAGTAGGIFLRRKEDASACQHMRELRDCTAAPRSVVQVASSLFPSCDAAMEADCGGERGAGRACMSCLKIESHHEDIKSAGCLPSDVNAFCGLPDPSPSPSPVPSPDPSPAPRPPPPQTVQNVTGCYIFGGSAGKQPEPECGMAPAHGAKGHAYISHREDGSIKVCLNQFCARRLSGNFTLSSNGVGFMTTRTDFGIGNCTHSISTHFPEEGLFAHIDFVFPAWWPKNETKTRGTQTDGLHSITGMFVNNGPALAGLLMMDPDVDQAECDRMQELPYCADFVPSSSASVSV